MKKNNILITCAKGNSLSVAYEIKQLGFNTGTIGLMHVETEGDFKDAMKLNLHLFSGTRVLYFLQNFKAKNPEELYKKINSIEWENWISPDSYISINSFAQNDYITDTRFANLKVKDAIVDRMFDLYNKRPDSGKEREGVVIFLHWREDECNIYLDTSGETIAKHGYRKIPLRAPMIESLASSVIISSKWDRNSTFVNPMCGSGTLAIEAALFATGAAPGLFRSNFGFMHVKNYEPKIWEDLKKEAQNKIKNTLPFRIIASDIDPNAIDAAKTNAATAGIDHLIDFQVCNFSNTEIPEQTGVVILNPEYGERLGEETGLEPVYQEIGDFFKQKCKGYTGYIFTGNFKLAKKIGLRTSRRIEFYNGKIECRLLEYELYEGTRKK